MALPFILFPSAITSIPWQFFLLPSAARAQAMKEQGRISTMAALSFKCSCYMGILCIGIFTRFGKKLGTMIFAVNFPGLYHGLMLAMSFMYLATTMGSIQNGLGKQELHFLQNIVAMGIRLAFVLFAVPVFGIRGYLWGFLVSELFLAFCAAYL